MYPLQNRPEVIGFITGSGGLDITTDIIKEVINYAVQLKKSAKSPVWLPKSIEKEAPEETKFEDIQIRRK